MMSAVTRVRIGSDCMGVVVESCRISAYMIEYAMERRGMSRKMIVCMWW